MHVRYKAILGLLLSVAIILLAGSAPQGSQSIARGVVDDSQAIEALLKEQEEELEEYRAYLQQAGEDTFQQKQGELLRAQAQQLHNEAKKLRTSLEAKYQVLTEGISQEILRQQLQLMLVSLDEGQQEARLARIAELEEERQTVRVELDAEYQAELHELQARHEERSRQAVIQLRAEIERAMEEEFAQYQLALLQDLEGRIAKMGPALASGEANR